VSERATHSAVQVVRFFLLGVESKREMGKTHTHTHIHTHTTQRRSTRGVVLVAVLVGGRAFFFRWWKANVSNERANGSGSTRKTTEP